MTRILLTSAALANRVLGVSLPEAFETPSRPTARCECWWTICSNLFVLE